MIVGYMRVSSVDQCLDRQLDGIELDRVYEEKISGKDRVELGRCIDSLLVGDMLYINEIHEVATNNKDLFNFLCRAKEKGADVHFVKGGLFVSGLGDLSLFEALAEFESKAIKERQSIGRNKAREQGVKMGRHPLSQSKIDEIIRRRLRGDNTKDIAKKMKIGRATVYKYI